MFGFYFINTETNLILKFVKSYCGFPCISPLYRNKVHCSQILTHNYIWICSSITKNLYYFCTSKKYRTELCSNTFVILNVKINTFFYQ